MSRRRSRRSACRCAVIAAAQRQIDGVTTFAGEAQFDAFLDGVKVLVNLLPHTPDTEGVLNRAHVLERLAPGAYLINLARGGHLVDDDLLDALQSGQIAAATLDVFHTNRCRTNHPFWQHAAHHDHAAYFRADTLREESIEQIAQKIDGADARRTDQRRSRCRTRLLNIELHTATLKDRHARIAKETHMASHQGENRRSRSA